MPKQKHQATLDKTLLAIAAVFLLVGIIALGFSQTLSSENRALIIIASSVGMLVCFAGLMSTNAFWKWLRKRIWRRAMSTWTESSHARNAPKFGLACQLSEGELRHLVIKIYSRMGYIIVNKDGGDDYIRLINPEGKIELVTCTQPPNPIEILNVYNLQIEMKKAKAVRGFFWSPGGFTSEVVHWARHKPIVLADKDEIGRLVDCAREKGSTLLE